MCVYRGREGGREREKRVSERERSKRREMDVCRGSMCVSVTLYVCVCVSVESERDRSEMDGCGERYGRGERETGCRGMHVHSSIRACVRKCVHTPEAT